MEPYSQVSNYIWISSFSMVNSACWRVRLYKAGKIASSTYFQFLSSNVLEGLQYLNSLYHNPSSPRSVPTFPILNSIPTLSNLLQSFHVVFPTHRDSTELF
ncbi:unnamed protein product [Hymenolepis diminuta]|uniref:Uncharacterized protein n=1 Tax=Hymenolepis diminuta TaxID=6216 RepID=A0A564YBC2_HYMDI|nr:unnamed protein product [Hymenolepis diminuta]